MTHYIYRLIENTTIFRGQRTVIHERKNHYIIDNLLIDESPRKSIHALFKQLHFLKPQTISHVDINDRRLWVVDHTPMPIRAYWTDDTITLTNTLLANEWCLNELYFCLKGLLYQHGRLWHIDGIGKPSQPKANDVFQVHEHHVKAIELMPFLIGTTFYDFYQDRYLIDIDRLRNKIEQLATKSQPRSKKQALYLLNDYPKLINNR